uniref:hypothetical protein n=1 Tax=Streptomyces albidoflavus TaxID=1886 RepID=UPI0038D0BEBE
MRAHPVPLFTFFCDGAIFPYWLARHETRTDGPLRPVPAPGRAAAGTRLQGGKALLERHMAERPGYAAYRARTGGFFPWPPRKR